MIIIQLTISSDERPCKECNEAAKKKTVYVRGHFRMTNGKKVYVRAHRRKR